MLGELYFQLLVYNLLEVAWHDPIDSFRTPGREAPSMPSPGTPEREQFRGQQRQG
jgi:hypothetical protein